MFGDRLKKLRGKSTQEDVAKFIGVSRARYSHYENGRSEPDLEVLKKLAEYFNVSIDYLIKGEKHFSPQLLIRQNLNRAREFCGLTPSDLANELGVSEDLVHKWESGKIKLSENEVDQINTVFSKFSERYRHALENPKSSSQMGIPVLNMIKVADINQEEHFVNVLENALIKNQQKKDNNDSLIEIIDLMNDAGIEDSGFFDIEEWKNLSPEDMIEIKKHFEWVAQKAKERNKNNN